ncbi:aminoglycoside phosphotransferase family protein [Tabrizicola sp.]|uniref:aminoglycoside phosphotransferase family protein n=1 Tax=Tabrizicola sp. TaxID=2005166 RepID=UPI003F31066D
MMTLAACLSQWHLTAPHQIAQTATSTVWKVTQPNGQPAVLKLLRPEETEEARGADYLEALAGQGAVRVYARSGQAILMEWCDGPPLGDLCRTGQDLAATEVLCDVIQTLHAARLARSGLEPLETRMLPLTQPQLPGDLATAAEIARALLADPVPRTALHGDLHHDNVLQTPRGWLAIDPKGVWGDPAYETANAFRNPDGAGDLLFQPARIDHLTDRFAHRLGQPPRRLLGWAAAHCVLSTFWSREAGLDIAADFRLLPILLAAFARAAES